MKSLHSLKKTREFKNVYENGTSYANKFLVMHVLPNDLCMNRVGISVSKKVGNSVVRHRLTRLIREAYRLSTERFVKGIDIVVVVRVTAKGRTYDEIRSALLHLGSLHRILVK